MRPAEIYVREPGLIAATWRDLVVFHWRGSTNVATMQRAVQMLARAAGPRGDARFGVLTIVGGSSITLPDAKMREALDAGRRYDANKYAEVAVLETTGILSAAVRGLIATASTLRRASFPFHTSATVRDACDWMAPYMGPEVDAPSLFRVVQHVAAQESPE